MCVFFSVINRLPLSEVCEFITHIEVKVLLVLRQHKNHFALENEKINCICHMQ